MGKYNDAYAEFTAKYDLTLKVQAEYKAAKQLAVMDDFVISTSPQEKAQGVYTSVLSSALASHLNKKVKVESGKSYDLSDFNIVDFINEFDKVMEAIRSDEAEEEKTNYTHRKLEGLPMGRVAKDAWTRVAAGFNKPLHEIWAGQIRKGTLTPENLKSVTDGSIRMLDDMIAGNMNYSDAANKDLANVVMAKNAMAEAINKRSWLSWLNPLNWGPNRRENAYLKALNEKINTYRQNNFPVDNVVPAECSSNMLGKALSELEKTYGAINQPAQPAQTAAKPEKKKEAKAQKKAEPKKKANKKEAVKPISAQLEEVIANKFDSPVFDDLYEYIKEVSGVDLGARKQILRVNSGTAFNPIVQLNKDFEDPERKDLVSYGGMDAGTSSRKVRDSENTVKEMAKTCFKFFYDNSTLTLGVTKGSEKSIAVAQTITNYVMNKFSPAKTEPEKYGKYADNYVLKDDKLLSELTGLEAGSKEITSARNIMHIKPEDVIKEADRTNLNLKSEDIEKKPVNQELSGKANEVPVKENNNLTK